MKECGFCFKGSGKPPQGLRRGGGGGRGKGEELQVLIYVLKKITDCKESCRKKETEEKLMKRLSYISLLFAFLDAK